MECCCFCLLRYFTREIMQWSADVVVVLCVIFRKMFSSIFEFEQILKLIRVGK